MLKRRLRAPIVFVLALAIVGTMFAGTALATQSPTENGVVPSLINGTSNNASLCSVQYPGSTELKFDPPTSGTLSQDGLSVTMTRPSTLTPSNANSIDWSVTGGTILAVIVKDGVDGSNNYDYTGTGYTSDRYLTTPNDGAKGISNVKFCYEGDTTPDAAPLVIDKDAAGTYENKYTWTIQKSVSPTGTIYTNKDTVTANYSVTVTRDSGTIGSVQVTGNITVTNPNGAEVSISGVTDELSDGTLCAVTGGGAQGLQPGDTEFVYACDLASLPEDPLTNKATVAWGEQQVGGAFLAAGSDVIEAVPVNFTGEDIDECVDVTDTVQGILGTVCDGGETFTYSRTITVVPGCTVYPNTATYTTNDTKTTGSASASLTICQTNKGGYTMGYWQNKNGQNDIKTFGKTFCGTLKTSYQNVLGAGTPMLDCSTDALFQSSVKEIIKAAESSGDGVAMFRAQFLATALSVRKTPALGSTGVSVDGSLFTPPTGDCLTVSALLDAADDSFLTLSADKTNLLTVKDYFDDINNNEKVTCVP